MHISICMHHEPITSSIGSETTVGKRAPKNKIFYPYPRTTAVTDHGITTRCAGAELLERVGVDGTIAGSVVARPPRPAPPCVRLVLVQQMWHLQGIHTYGEEASPSGLLGPRGQLGLGRGQAAGGRHMKIRVSGAPLPQFI